MKQNFLSALTLVAIVSCSEQPAREKFPGPPGRTTDLQQAQATKDVMGGTDSFSKGLSDGSTQNSGKKIGGTIRLAPNIKAPATYTLFIAARRPEGGPPLAVLRRGVVTFPYKFELSSANVMIPGTPFEGQVIMSVSLDQDGDPISKSPGDAAAFVEAEIGQTDLEITVDKSIQ